MLLELDAEFLKIAFSEGCKKRHLTSNPKMILASYNAFFLESLVLHSRTNNSTTVCTLISGLTYEGVTNGFKMFAENFKYETLSDLIESKNLGEDIASQIPLCTDAPLIWNAFLKFFKSYIDIFYTDDENVSSDKGKLPSF